AHSPAGRLWHYRAAAGRPHAVPPSPDGDLRPAVDFHHFVDPTRQRVLGHDLRGHRNAPNPRLADQRGLQQLHVLAQSAAVILFATKERLIVPRFVTVAKTSEIGPGERDVFGVDDYWIAVFNVGG